MSYGNIVFKIIKRVFGAGIGMNQMFQDLKETYYIDIHPKS